MRGIGDGLQAADDGAVRATLSQELERLQKADPAQALGLPASADPAALRAHFLDLVKVYHPNRFARRPRDVVRLANEVFLLLRRAYEQWGEDNPVPGTTSAAGPITQRLRARDISPPSQPKLEVDAALARRRRARSYPMIPSVSSTPPPATAAQTATPVPSAPRPPPPAPPPPRATTTTFEAPTSIPFSKLNPPHFPATSASEVVERARRREEQQEERFRTAVNDLRAGRLGTARDTLRSLMAENPNEHRYRVYYHHVVGREHDLANRSAEAAAEYDRALAFDPGFEPARQARARLDAEPRREPGRRLGRWFRK